LPDSIKHVNSPGGGEGSEKQHNVKKARDTDQQNLKV